MSTTETRTALPVGTWKTDATHSTLDFSVRHMLVGKFRASIPTFAATLTVTDSDANLEGTAPVSSIVAADENLTAHLQAPDFFDGERFPELTFTATHIHVEGEKVTAHGDLTVKGITKPIELTGEVTGPAADPYGGERLGLDLQTEFDRTQFGLTFNAPMPTGGFILADTVRVTAQLELVRA